MHGPILMIFLPQFFICEIMKGHFKKKILYDGFFHLFGNFQKSWIPVFCYMIYLFDQTYSLPNKLLTTYRKSLMLCKKVYNY